MIIDLHTHIFPDKVASGALEVLLKSMEIHEGKTYPPQTDGTLNGLLGSMTESGIDISITMPIATKPSQTDSINRFVMAIDDKRIVSFGAVHPLSENAFDVLEKLKQSGIKGVKIHPEFQDFYIDSKESIEFLKKAEELSLYVMVHAGADVGFAPPVKCTPERIGNVLKCIKGDRLIAAHLGGFRMWDDVERYLVGTPVLLDTAFISRFISKEQVERIIKNHGSEKILFGSDSPWESPVMTKEFIDSLSVSDEEKENIFCKNALRILS
ncbi:MAG: amidohydrolase family protein [Clostridia bacterium]|nr:amidohydrolase family protein [Clostridia bacterium]